MKSNSHQPINSKNFTTKLENNQHPQPRIKDFSAFISEFKKRELKAYRKDPIDQVGEPSI